MILLREGFTKTLTYIQKHGYVMVLLVLFSFFYFYHLDYTTLSSWDEGWYASISRTMIETGDYMNMKWLGKPFYDHPPMGMWLVALSYKILGVSEFSTRLPSAILGIGALLVMYLLGRDMFRSKEVGFASALILGTAIWFFARARSGNLDAAFCFFYATSIYTAFKAYSKPIWFLGTGIAFGLLIMTKTLIGISALPLILYISFPRWIQPKTVGYFIAGALLSALIIVPWYSLHLTTYPEFFHHHFRTIGTRERTMDDYFHFGPAKQVLFYLHMGIGSWYKVWIASLFWLSLRFVSRSQYRREVLFLLLWNFGILFPFLSSEQSQLWHLIPVYIPISLTVAYTLWDGIDFLLSRLKKMRKIHLLLFLSFISLVALKNIKSSYKELIPEYRYISERVQISQATQAFSEKIYLDDDFLPEAIYYAGRDITPISAAAPEDPEYKNTLRGQFQTDEDNFIVITRAWATHSLDDAGIPYIVRAENKEFKIISRPSHDQK